MRPSLLLAILGLCLPATGCQLFVTAPRNVLFELCDRTGNWTEQHRDRKQAHAVWNDHRNANPQHKYSSDYGAGFEDGFVDFIEVGESIEPLTLLPDRYQKVRYQSPQGVQAIEDWVAGFHEGADAARQGGYREQVILPRSLFVGDHAHQHELPGPVVLPGIGPLEPIGKQIPAKPPQGTGEKLQAAAWAHRPTVATPPPRVLPATLLSRDSSPPSPAPPILLGRPVASRPPATEAVVRPPTMELPLDEGRPSAPARTPTPRAVPRWNSTEPKQPVAAGVELLPPHASR